MGKFVFQKVDLQNQLLAQYHTGFVFHVCLDLVIK